MREQRSYPSGPIRIGDDVWTGTEPIIPDGVTNGSHAVAGAGAVVARDVPERAIVAGLPVKVMRQRN
jgi:acetyltransferase-like isoleucine patch superfamily enzyme